MAHRPDGSTVVVSEEGGECPRCRRMAAFLVNRNGRTVCSACDAVEVPEEHLKRERNFLERMRRVLEEPAAANAKASEEGPWFVPA